MATPAKYVQTNTLYLSGSGVLVGATSVNLTSFTDIYGNVLTMSDFGAKGYGTLEPDTANEEAFTFIGVTANANGTYTLTGVQTALAKFPYTQASGLVRAHAGGTKMVISDNVAFWDRFANKDNDETITGTWIFNVSPIALSNTPASTTILGNMKATVAPSKNLGTTTITIATPAVVSLTAHGLIAGDSVQFTTSGALPTGIVASTNYYVIAAGLTANAFEIAATVGGSAINTTGTQSGTHTLFRTTPFGVVDNDPRILQNAYAVDTGVANTYAITLATNPTAYATGQVFLFKALNPNNAASTLNVNGLGAKTIKKDNAADLASGDILANQIIEVLYDGTNFQLISRTQVASTTTTQTFIASGTWTKPTSGTMAFIEVWGAGGSGGSTGGVHGCGGGGGGAYVSRLIKLSLLGATETVTLGTGGVGVSGNSNGNIGGNTTFGSWVTSYGGGGGGTGGAAGGGGGGGGGGTSVGNTATNATGATGGEPGGGVGGAGTGIGGSEGGGAGGAAGFTGGAGGMGGAGGGGGNIGGSGAGSVGGAALYGGGGGGGGGTVAAAGGTSMAGGAGGVGSAGVGLNGGAGVQPGGGGGGAIQGTSGAGALGQVTVTVF